MSTPRHGAPGPSSRTARSVVFATVCVVLAVSAHTWSGAPPVAGDALVIAFAGSLLIGYALTAAERSLPTLTTVLLGGQFMLHALFSGCAQAANAGHAGLHGPGAVAISPDGAGHDSALMTVTHTGAAAVCAWWMRRGERAVWAAGRRLAVRFLPPAMVVDVPVPVRPRWVPASPPPARTRRLPRHDAPRRAPPFQWTPVTTSPS